MKHEGGIFVFSDAHLMEFTPKDQPRFALGMALAKKARIVIANGDIIEPKHQKQVWESKWREFLEVIKQKGVVLGGNHDKITTLRKMRPFWAKLAGIYRFTSNNTRFVVTHGDRFDTALNWDKGLDWKIIDKWYLSIKFLEERLTLPGNRNLLTWFYRSWNEEQKKRFHEIATPTERKIAGHTHLAEIDVFNFYVNIGSFNRQRPSWAWIEDGNISLHIFGNPVAQTIHRDQK